jgi:hypothetical protein
VLRTGRGGAWRIQDRATPACEENQRLVLAHSFERFVVGMVELCDLNGRDHGDRPVAALSVGLDSLVHRRSRSRSLNLNDVASGTFAADRSGSVGLHLRPREGIVIRFA